MEMVQQLMPDKLWELFLRVVPEAVVEQGYRAVLAVQAGATVTEVAALSGSPQRRITGMVARMAPTDRR
ncbi:hypothetical protein ABZY10_24105 [Streptomyces sp. NPDC006539]|uniref:hypothetical protein n=1 Tax=Streptomyces sp. NPDC006539 TaxID=3155352 RepID=UPI0033A8F774